MYKRQAIYDQVLSRSLNTTALESELSDLEAEINIAAELIEDCIDVYKRQAITGNDQVLIQGYSKLTVTPGTATSKNGASIVSYSAVCSLSLIHI